MLIYVDQALEEKLTGLTYGDTEAPITVVPMNKDVHNELREEQKYPGITWMRIDRMFDVTRYLTGDQQIKTKDVDGIDVIDIYASPNPYNVMYQIELLAKERYDADILDVFFDEQINPRGDVLSIKCIIEETNSETQIKFPMRIVESRYLNETEDSKNVYYRRVITVSVRLLIDPLILERTDYMIKNDVSVKEL